MIFSHLAVIIIVVAVPEGLPMMIAIVLAQNMRKLLKSNVLVRQLMGVETSGSLNLLFTDKTGTITKGKLEAAGFMSIAGGSGQVNLNHYQTFESIPVSLINLLDISLRENTSCVVNCDAENEIERINVLSAGNESILPNMLSQRITDALAAAPSPPAKKTPVSVSADGKTRTLRALVEGVETEAIQQGLIRTHWNKSQLAKELGISRSNLIQKCTYYGLDRKN